MDQFWVILWSALGTVVTGLATWLTAYVVGLLNAKIKDRKLARWSTEVTTIVFNAVQCVFQTFVDTMKKAGKWDAAAAEEAKQKALDMIKCQLTYDLRKYITDNFGDMEAWLVTQIESAIYSLKR